MNLVEKLIAIDKGEFEKIGRKEIKSKKLSEVLGENAHITIQAVDGDTYVALSASELNSKGGFEYSKAFSTNAKIAAAGIVEPNLKDEALLKHLGVPTPAEAAKKIFRGEINGIAEEISKLSGFIGDEETIEEIKN